MAQSIRDLMTPDPVSVDEATTLREVAAVMRDKDLGDVIVSRQGMVGGIVTDRDIVVRAVARGEDAGAMVVGDICTDDLVTVAADDPIRAVARTMADAAVRRVPVVDGDEVVGIISLADLARATDPDSVLGELAAKPPNA